MNNRSERRWLRSTREETADGTRSLSVTHVRPKPSHGELSKPTGTEILGQGPEAIVTNRTRHRDDKSPPYAARLSLGSRDPVPPLAVRSRDPCEGLWEDALRLPSP